MKALMMLFLCLGTFTVELAQADLVEANLDYSENGKPLEGYLAYDSGISGKRPGVLIIHQWKGISAHEKGIARRLAELGYVALAADIYGKGIRPANNDEAGKQATLYKKDTAAFRARAKAGLEALKARPEVNPNKIVAIGYCFGGTGVLELARSGAPVLGVVSFHGGLSTPNPQSSNIKAKVLVHHGTADPHVPAAEVAGFISEMTEHKVDWQLSYYGGAVHAFTDKGAGDDPSKGVAYNAEADRRSWSATVELFKEVFGA